MAITQTWLKANHKKERTKEIVKTDREGLGVRVSPKGKITYVMRYYYDQKPKRIDIGSYPLMLLKEARLEHQRLKAKLEQGHDPKIIRQLERTSIVDAASLESMFEQWYNTYCIQNKKNHHEIKRSFEIYVFPILGKLPVEEITIHHWLEILEDLAPKIPAISERILTNTKQLLKWGVRRKLITTNCLSDIQASVDLQIEKRVATRSLSDDEIRWVWEAIEQSRMAHKNKLFIKLCLIYGCRNGEMRLAKKEHFNFDSNVWTVPPENHKLGKKTKKPLLRPIVPTIETLVREAMSLNKSDYLFTNTDSNNPMSHSAPLALPYNVMQWLRKNKKIEMEHWSMHDLRKTARTNYSTITDPHVAEIMLGHSLGKIWRTYDHHDYLKEQANAYKSWCERLYCIVDQDKVISLDVRRRVLR